MKRFVWRTLLGGLFVVVPVAAILIVLQHAVSALRAALRPLAPVLPVDALFPGLWAVLLLLILSFGAGLALQVGPVHRRATTLNRALAARFPFYRLLSDAGGHLLDGEPARPVKAALAEIEQALVPAFVMEELPDGRYVVFVPTVPTPLQGAVYILGPERVHLVDASLVRVARCISRWGVGSGELVRAIRKA